MFAVELRECCINCGRIAIVSTKYSFFARSVPKLSRISVCSFNKCIFEFSLVESRRIRIQPSTRRSADRNRMFLVPRISVKEDNCWLGRVLLSFRTYFSCISHIRACSFCRINTLAAMCRRFQICFCSDHDHRCPTDIGILLFSKKNASVAALLSHQALWRNVRSILQDPFGLPPYHVRFSTPRMHG